jgi:hypothetical protein
MKTINRNELRNMYLDLSIELSDVKTFEEFCKFLPKTLPFLKKYSEEMLVNVLIEEVENKEFELTNK